MKARTMIRSAIISAYSAGTAIAAVLMADGVAHDTASPPWQAIAQLGLATVLATISFCGLIWWFKKNADKIDKDSAARDKRISQLEKFQQDKLIELIESALACSIRNSEAIEQFTKAFEGRTCVAMQMMTPERRQKVERAMKGGD